VHLLRYVINCAVPVSPFSTQVNYWKCPPSAWIHLLTRVIRELVTLWSMQRCWCFLQRWEFAGVVLLSCSPCVGLFGEQNITHHTVWGLELILQHDSNRLHMSAGSRSWMRWIRYRYIPSVCHVRQTLRAEASTSGLNYRANSES